MLLLSLLLLPPTSPQTYNSVSFTSAAWRLAAVCLSVSPILIHLTQFLKVHLTIYSCFSKFFFFKLEYAKEGSNYRTIALISHASKVMLKILQARLQQYVKREIPDVQAGFRKGRGTRDQIANIRWIIEKAREFQKKHLFLLYWLCQSLWLCGSQ